MEVVRRTRSEDFWQEKPATTAGMLLQDDVSDLGQAERAEILGQLPRLGGKEVLELGAGIGRYTSHFVREAKHVTAVDFVERFLEQNREATAQFNNVTHHCANVLDLEFEPESFDFVFWNWLLMYLSDSEMALLREKIRMWTRVGGAVFLRESCFPNALGKHTANDNPATYRPHDQYTRLFDGDFRLLRKGNVKAYEQLFNRGNQHYWLYLRSS